jgi:hypothetical protein
MRQYVLAASIRGYCVPRPCAAQAPDGKASYARLRKVMRNNDTEAAPAHNFTCQELAYGDAPDQAADCRAGR